MSNGWDWVEAANTQIRSSKQKTYRVNLVRTQVTTLEVLADDGNAAEAKAALVVYSDSDSYDFCTDWEPVGYELLFDPEAEGRAGVSD